MGWVLWNFRERFYDSIEARRELNIFSFFKKKTVPEKKYKTPLFLPEKSGKGKDISL